MAIELQQILALLAFALVLLGINIKANETYVMLPTFIAMVATLVVAGVLLVGWI